MMESGPNNQSINEYNLVKEKSITGHRDLELYSVHSRSGHVQVLV